jgi:DNA-3-methyladenine glycosylase
VKRAVLDVDALVAARALLGAVVVRDSVALRITEVEAYRGPEDTAAHSAKGRTARTEPMFGPAGHAYIYLVYGMHHLLNVVTGPPGHCVLVRSCEVVEGLPLVTSRRGGKQGPTLLNGPGKVGQALALTTTLSGADLIGRGDFRLTQGTPPARVLAGPRVGIDYADPADQAAPWRLADADSAWVGHRRTLRSA